MSLHDLTKPNTPNTSNDELPWFELAAAHTRTHYTGDSQEASATERRIVEVASRRRRKLRALWLVPIAVIGSGSLAWAEEVQHAVKWTVTQVRELVRNEPSVATTEPGRTAPNSHTSASNSKTPGHVVPANTPSSTSPSEVETTEAEASTNPSPEHQAPDNQTPDNRTSEPESVAEAQRVSRRTDAPQGASSSASPGRRTLEPMPPHLPSATAPSDLERYRKGYVAQFERGDYVAALNAWDEYLRNVPGGRFTPDVRYNRALVLAKLGREQEAITALQPFAAGAYGPSRQQSAAKLIAKLQTP